ncbi:MAG: CDP-alcohol phosphatidyltransferase [Actinobacteria bacterium]|nr:MAG: CDP-alcohol phosphatidyltransferase [Actinomycetota bacterium]
MTQAAASIFTDPNSTWMQRFQSARGVLDAAQKPGNGVPAYTRWVNRRIARLVASIAAAFHWTPNIVTAISFTFSALGMAILIAFPPSIISGIGAAFFLAVGYICDSADGQVARLTGTSSKTGEWVDHVVDAFRSPAIHLTTAIALMIYRPEQWWLAIVALVYGAVTSTQFLSQILAEAFIRAAQRPQRRGGTLRSFVLLPTDPGTLCWSFIFWGIAAPFATVYTTLAVIAVSHAAVSMRRRYRDLSALDRENHGERKGGQNA